MSPVHSSCHLAQRLGPIMALALVIAVASDPSLAQPSRPGAYTAAPIGAPDVIAAATFAVGEQQRSMRRKPGGGAARVDLLAIEAAERQVVAGLSFRLTLRTRLNGKVKRAQAVVWSQAWRKPDVFRLTGWRWL